MTAVFSLGRKVARIHIDANGNLTNDGNGKTYAYDAANRMVSCTQTVNGVQTVTGYVYDGKGRRVQETSNGTVVKQWVWCPRTAQPCEERDASNNVTKRFYGMGEQIGGANYYLTFDHQNSVREMTNASGALVARYDYDPYGRRTLVSGTDLADFGFTGFYYDQATGLDLTYTRAYDANLGRWLSRDPIAEAGGINLYAYCVNSPVNAIDPLGLDAVFNFTNGTSTRVTTTKDFISTAKSAADQSITGIDFVNAHGNQTKQGIGSDSQTTDVVGYQPKTDALYVSNEDLSQWANLKDLLQSKLGPNAYIRYNGCETAKGNDNITKKTSEVFPNVRVTGNTADAYGWDGFDTTFFGHPSTYVNGQRIK